MQPQKLGPYRIVRKLGEGGMGAVFEAVDDAKSLRAAVKVLPELLAKKQGFRTRFEIEIEALRKLEHPNIVRILGFGEQDGTLFYAMELVEGQDLESVLESRQRLTAAQTVDIGIQLAKALKHAHDRGIIHRDIKPANIMILSDGTIKLSDFGIAKRYGNTGLTMEGGPIGTANYMSPEQTEGKKATERSDLYSVGCLFFALLAGRPPFVSESLYKILELQRKARPELVTIFAPATPEPFAALIDKLLEKEPEKRPANCGVLMRALTMIHQGLQLTGEAKANQAKETGRMPSSGAFPPLRPDVPGKPAQDSVMPQPMGASGQSPRSFLNNLGDVTVSTSTPAESEPGFNTRNIEGAGGGGGNETIATNPGRPLSPASGHGKPGESSEMTMASGFVDPPDLTGDSMSPMARAATGDTNPGSIPGFTRSVGPVGGPEEGATMVSGPGLAQRGERDTLVSGPGLAPQQGAGPGVPQDVSPATFASMGNPNSDSVIELTTSLQEEEVAPTPQIKRGPGPAPEPIGPPKAKEVAGPGPASSMFVTAEQAAKADREREELEARRAPAAPIVGRTSLVLLAVVVIICGFWVYFHQPVSADKLYQTISTAVAGSNPDQMEEVESEMREFLNRFPNDERAERIKGYYEEVDLIKTERRLLIRSRRLTGAFSGTPAEQIYLSALAASRTDPEAGLARFEAFVGLFQAGIKRDPGAGSVRMGTLGTSKEDDAIKETEKYIKLAGKRIVQLREDITRQKGSQLILIQQQLEMARKAKGTDPERARRVCESIIMLYHDRTWASTWVGVARELMTQLPPAGSAGSAGSAEAGAQTQAAP
jgi:serine/threonine protein kinase